MIPKEVIWSHI